MVYPDHYTTNKDFIREVYQTGKNLDAKYKVEQQYGIQPQPFQDWLLPQLALTGSEHVLDVGCGQGRFILPIGRLAKGKGGHLIGCDLSEGVMSSAQAIAAHESLPIKFIVADAEHLPFSEDYFDLVMANHMLYHVANINSALHEAYRVLKPGGRFLATTNSQYSMSELGDLHKKTMRELAIPYSDERPPGRFTLEDGASQLNQVFEHVHLLTLDSGFYVTTPDPALSYYMATRLYQAPYKDPNISQATRERIAPTFRDITAETIQAAGGSFIISKLVGAFICQKPSQ